jgi:RNA polymerase sigma-70 factor (ECF subfamily)
VTQGEVLSREEDVALVEQAKKGELNAFSSIVEKHKSRALRLAYSFTKDWQEAEDLSQEAFVRAYYSLAQLRDGASFYYWFNRILVNKCLRHKKKQSDRLVSNSEPGELAELNVRSNDKNPGEALLQKELNDVMEKAMDLLSPREKLAFILTLKEGMTLQEAAESMGCRLGTVKSLTFRAVHKLRRLLNPYVKD